jgi:hypothetical protein
LRLKPQFGEDGIDLGNPKMVAPAAEAIERQYFPPETRDGE